MEGPIHIPKIVRVLKIVSKNDRKEFLGYIKLQRHQSNSPTFELASLIVSTIDEAELKKSPEQKETFLTLEIQKAFSKYPKQTFAYLQNRLLTLFNSYTSRSTHETPDLESQFQRVRFWIKNQGWEHAKLAKTDAETTIRGLPMGPYRLRMQHNLEWESIQLNLQQENRSAKDWQPVLENCLDTYYLAARLKLMVVKLNEALVLAQVNGDSDLNKAEEFLRFIQKQHPELCEDHVYIQPLCDLCYGLIFRLRRMQSDNRVAKQDDPLPSKNPFPIIPLTKLSEFSKASISNPELHDLCTAWLSALFEDILRGENDGFRHAFDIYTFMAKEKLILDAKGYVNIFHLKNLARIGIETQEFKTVDKIVLLYRELVPPNHARNFLLYLDILMSLEVDPKANLESLALRLEKLREPRKGHDLDLFLKLDIYALHLRVLAKMLLETPSRLELVEEMLKANERLRKHAQDSKSKLSFAFEIAYRNFSQRLKHVLGIIESGLYDLAGFRKTLKKIKAAQYCIERPWLERFARSACEIYAGSDVGDDHEDHIATIRNQVSGSGR